MDYTMTMKGKTSGQKNVDVCKAAKKHAGTIGAYTNMLKMPDMKCPMSQVYNFIIILFYDEFFVSKNDFFFFDISIY